MRDHHERMPAVLPIVVTFTDDVGAANVTDVSFDRGDPDHPPGGMGELKAVGDVTHRQDAVPWATFTTTRSGTSA